MLGELPKTTAGYEEKELSLLGLDSYATREALGACAEECPWALGIAGIIVDFCEGQPLELLVSGRRVEGEKLRIVQLLRLIRQELYKN